MRDRHPGRCVGAGGGGLDDQRQGQHVLAQIALGETRGDGEVRLDTRYGRLLLAKGAAFALVLWIASGIRRHALPGLARPRGVGGAARVLRASVGLELGLALVLLALSAALAGTAPPG